MEAGRAAQILRYSAGEAFRPVGELFEQSVTGGPVYTVHRPVGVVGLITPWNFPAAIPVWKLAPALDLRQHDRAQARAGLAADRPAHRARARRRGAARGRPQRRHRARLARSARRWSSTPACARSRSPARCRSARASASRPGRLGKRAQLELGGHNPLIVMADADLGKAAEAAYAGAFWSAGQKCTATRRIYVQDEVYDAFRDALPRARRVGPRRRPGRPRDRGRAARQRERDGRRAVRDRARPLRGRIACSPAAGARDDDAYLVAPTVFEDVADDAMLSCEEVFGPVTSLYRFGSLDEAIERANAVEFGLSAALFTSSLPATQQFVEHARGGHPPRQLPDRRRRRPRPVRRRQGLGLRPARAGPRGARVLHRGRHRLSGREARRRTSTAAG